MLELYKNIKKKRLELKMTQTDLAQKAGYADKSMIAKIESGKVDLPQSKIELFAKILITTPGELMGYDNQEDRVSSDAISIPILNTVVAGLPLSAYADADVIGYEEVSRKLGSPDELFALKVVGDSMLPVLQEGDIIVVKQQPDVESGDIAIVLINGDEATVKKVMKSQEGITLIAFNPAVYEPHFYPNDEIVRLPVTIAGKVVEMKRSF